MNRRIWAWALLVLLVPAMAHAATYLSKGSGNFTSTGTWGSVGAATAEELDTNAANTAVAAGGAYAYSATFIPTNVAIDGIAIKVLSRAASPSGTISIQLYNNTTAAEAFAVTLNLSDIGVDGGWYVVTGAVTPNGTDAYKIGTKTSASATAISLYRDATASNWARMVRTATAAGARAATDKFLIAGECSAAATCTTHTVLMDETVNTSYGPTVSGGPPCGMVVGKYGVLNWNTAAAFNPYLRVKGILCNWGTVTIGTPGGTAIPTGSTAVLEFGSVAAADSGIVTFSGGVFKTQGTPLTKVTETALTASVGGWVTTLGTAVTATTGMCESFIGMTGAITINGTGYTISGVSDATHLTLTGSAGTQATPVKMLKASTGTILKVGDTTGWANGDTIDIAGSGTNQSEVEEKVIATVDSSTQVTITTAFAYPHLGTGIYAAEVVNITRNVILRGMTAAFYGHVTDYDGSTVDLEGTETNFTEVRPYQNGNGATTIAYSAIHNCNGYAIGTLSMNAGGIRNITLSHVAVTNASNGIYLYYPSYGHDFNYVTVMNNPILLNCFGPGGVPAQPTCSFQHITQTGGTLTTPLQISGGTTATDFANVTLKYLTVHNTYNNGSGTKALYSDYVYNALFTNLLFYHMTAGDGLDVCREMGQGAFWTLPCIYDTATIIGCSNTGVYVWPQSTSNTGAILGNVLRNFTLAGDALVAQPYGIVAPYDLARSSYLTVQNSTLGVATAPYVQHSGSDLYFINYVSLQWYFDNVKLASTTEMTGFPTSLLPFSFIRSHDHDQVHGAEKSWFRAGTVETDTTPIAGHTQPYQLLAPVQASPYYLRSGRKCAAIQAGATATFSVYLYKNAAYNGVQPRLVLLANYGAGVTPTPPASSGSTMANTNSDLILATATGGTLAWEQLTGTSPIVSEDTVLCTVVEVNGTVGTVDLDDWTVS
jgi:hypothetical protein